MSVIRILYVEDDLDFGCMTKVFLDQAGFLVELTTNVEEAWLRHVSLVYDCLTFHSTRWK